MLPSDKWEHAFWVTLATSILEEENADSKFQCPISENSDLNIHRHGKFTSMRNYIRNCTNVQISKRHSDYGYLKSLLNSKTHILRKTPETNLTNIEHPYRKVVPMPCAFVSNSRALTEQQTGGIQPTEIRLLRAVGA